MGLSQHLLDLENQVQELQQRVSRLEGTPAQQPTGPYLGPAISQKVHETLWEAGYMTLEDLRAATDEELLQVPGIGKGTLHKIRLALD